MEQFYISKELTEKVLNYLATQPYGSVYQFMGELMTLKPVEQVKEPVTKAENE